MNSKIKKSLFFLFFILSGIFFPVRLVLAGWARELGLWIATWPIFQIAKMLIDLAIFIAGLCGRLLNWVLSPNFIKLPYTTPGQPPTGNPIIEAGLGVTQGFVNMLLVLVLVYIAIATILRLAGYETKKLLVTFIVVALLVNFAPVLCGLIVDASNIIMNFFVQDLKADAFGESMGTKVSQILSGYDATSTWEQARPFMMQIIIMVPFLFALSFVFLIFTAIFILRYLVIWLLVILSPLAFVAYILPATRKYFEQWWKQFLAWTFIGVTCGFFLYLGLMLVTYVPTTITPPTTGQTGAFDAVLPYFVSLIFLGIGIVFGLSTSAIGASTVINFAKSKGRATVRGVGKGAKWAGERVAQKGIRPLLEKARTKEAVGKIARGVEKVRVLRWFMPEKARLYGQMKPAIDKAKAQAASYSSQTLAHRLLKKSDVQTDATGNLMTILERGDAQDLFNEAKKLRKWKDKSDQEILNDREFQDVLGRPLDIAQKGGMHSDILRRDPRLAAIAATKGIAGYQGLSSQDAIKKAVNEARAQHISSWEPEVFENKDVIEAALGKFDRERWLQINRTIKRGQDSALTGIDNAFKEFVKANKLEAEVIQNKSKVWGKYQDYIKKQTGGEGYFKSLEDKRVQQIGWRAAEYRPGISPGAAAMGGPPPTPPGTKYVESKVVHKPSPSDTGEAKKKKRKEPDVGNP